VNIDACIAEAGCETVN